MTQKAGQKCTAIRRVLVPAAVADRLRDDLVDRLSAIVVGNPAHEGVRMGPVATAAQRDDVREGIVGPGPGRAARARERGGRRGRRAARQGLLRLARPRRAGGRGRGARRPRPRGVRARGHDRSVFGSRGRRGHDRGPRPRRPRVVGLLRRPGLHDRGRPRPRSLPRPRVPRAAPRSRSSRRVPAPCCRSSSTAVPAAPAAARSWAACAGSRSTGSASPSKARAR